jgi:hypothetical protein
MLTIMVGIVCARCHHFMSARKLDQNTISEAAPHPALVLSRASFLDLNKKAMSISRPLRRQARLLSSACGKPNLQVLSD